MNAHFYSIMFCKLYLANLQKSYFFFCKKVFFRFVCQIFVHNVFIFHGKLLILHSCLRSAHFYHFGILYAKNTNT